MKVDDFTKAGFTVVSSEEKENNLLKFLKAHYPSVIKDNELNINELKSLLGLPINEKVNGYGLNFVGRGFARAKYAQKTKKEVHLNKSLSKNIDETQNLVIKGDNLDSLKILKNYYRGKIKCIYIDPPYNTANDEFIYPDKFDKEEAEVLGFANLSDDDFDRLDFSFKTKKSHNGWLSFMYPRLLLARDLLSDDGVIFISIDDNEQANLKLLCDDVFGEENCVAEFIWERAYSPKNDAKYVSTSHDYILMFAKNLNNYEIGRLPRTEAANARYSNPDNDPRGVWKPSDLSAKRYTPQDRYNITTPKGRVVEPPAGRSWRVSEKAFSERLRDGRIWFGEDGNSVPQIKRFLSELKHEGMAPTSLLFYKDVGHSQEGAKELVSLFEGKGVFEGPKPHRLIERLLKLANLKDNSIILDFFAGSGTTGHAVMELNKEDGGSRKFILCQIDEPIKKDKPAYKFCIENNLPTFVSSITIERLRRAGEKIEKEIEEKRGQNSLFNATLTTPPPPPPDTPKLDTGFKVFDTVNAPKLEVDDTGQIEINLNHNDALSRIYNMIFTVGLDEPTQVPEEVLKDAIYKIDNHYYITNGNNIREDDYLAILKKAFDPSCKGSVFIDGWTASLNATLQSYRDDVKIVF